MFSSPFLVPFCVKYDKCCPANVPIPRCPIHTTNTLRNSATARNFNTPCLFQTAKAQNWPPNGATPFNQWATLGWVWFEDTTSHELMQLVQCTAVKYFTLVIIPLYLFTLNFGITFFDTQLSRNPLNARAHQFSW